MATILVDIFNCIFLNNDGTDVGNLQYVNIIHPIVIKFPVHFTIYFHIYISKMVSVFTLQTGLEIDRSCELICT